MKDRSAVDTIIGYFYQFDRAMLEILSQVDPQARICVEGIEDVDLSVEGELSAIQCKYYAKTEYNHSVIKEAVIFMLKHYAGATEKINYHICSFYKSGQEKLKEITVEFLKANFLTYVKTERNDQDEKVKVTHKIHEELGLNDDDLLGFIGFLKIDLKSQSFEYQYKSVVSLIVSNLGVSSSEAERYHYNAALKLVRDLSTRQDKAMRTIAKHEFIEGIRGRDEVFDSWFIRRKGRTAYVRSIRAERLSGSLNMDPYDRFFLIDSCGVQDLGLIKEVIRIVVGKWSAISDRRKPSYCPAIYIHGLESAQMVELKRQLYASDYKFVDCYPYRGSDMCADHFYIEPTSKNGVKFRFFDDLESLAWILAAAPRTVEIYQFYRTNPFCDFSDVKNVRVRVEDFHLIKEMTV